VAAGRHVKAVTREERLKAALRANLTKRKMRERGEADAPAVADPGPALYPPPGGPEDKICEQDS
jgi:hypothetical protein